MIIGYARVSTRDQKLNLQVDALKKAGCKKMYKEIASGAKADRPKLSEMMNNFREGDTLIVWKLDRLGRSLKHLVELVAELSEKGVGFKSIQDPFIDTTTPQGKLIFNIFASLAEFERDIISERTKAGLEAARARGRVGGRPKGLSKEAEKTALAAESLYKDGQLSIKEITDRLNISRSTLYSYLRQRGVKVGKYNKKY